MELDGSSLEQVDSPKLKKTCMQNCAAWVPGNELPVSRNKSAVP
jgi:hypothetical protein